LCYITPGNAYPVTGNDKLNGAAINSGYQSHFVLTDVERNVNPVPGAFMEFVVAQETQVVPVYLFTFAKSPDREIPLRKESITSVKKKRKKDHSEKSKNSDSNFLTEPLISDSESTDDNQDSEF